MKRAVALFLALVMVFALCACGKSNAIIGEVELAEAQEESADAVSVNLGKLVDVGFADMTLDVFEIKNSYKFSHTDGVRTKNCSITTNSGLCLVCLSGKFTNKTTSEIRISDSPIYAQMNINGNIYNTSIRLFIVEDAEILLGVVPQQKVDYFLYAEVPENVVNSITECEVLFGFVENMDRASSIDDLDYLFTLNTIPTDNR